MEVLRLGVGQTLETDLTLESLATYSLENFSKPPFPFQTRILETVAGLSFVFEEVSLKHFLKVSLNRF